MRAAERPPRPTPKPGPPPPCQCNGVPTAYVCGADDKTYTSACAAGCAGVGVQYTGQCKPIPSPGEGGGPACCRVGAVHLQAPPLAVLPVQSTPMKFQTPS